MEPGLQRILEFLKRNKVRATYKAVADCVGVPQRSLGSELGHKGQAASWVVSKTTGNPTGYLDSQMDPDLFTSQEIILTSEDLRFRMRREGL